MTKIEKAQNIQGMRYQKEVPTHLRVKCLELAMDCKCKTAHDKRVRTHYLFASLAETINDVAGQLAKGGAGWSKEQWFAFAKSCYGVNRKTARMVAGHHKWEE